MPWIDRSVAPEYPHRGMQMTLGVGVAVLEINGDIALYIHDVYTSNTIEGRIQGAHHKGIQERQFTGRAVAERIPL